MARVGKEISAFQLLTTPEIIDIITRETNREAERVTREWNNENPNNQKEWLPTSTVEVQTFVGLLILASIHRGRLEPPKLAAVMSLNGIKIWWACDAETCYPLAGEIYLGRQPGSVRVPVW